MSLGVALLPHEGLVSLTLLLRLCIHQASGGRGKEGNSEEKLWASLIMILHNDS